ncbi:MAG: domain containing protein [Myxococcales bacterium]|nr:domain containing protein [Myxococcales bacterium]
MIATPAPRTIYVMGRAPNPGAPQRVSAHVVPKAKSFSESEEDDKTAIESGWEEEASTTVEQGEVAEKIRALGVEPPRPAAARSVTNVTSTVSQVDELTVDDGRANPNLALPITANAARLVITQGNEAGQEVEVQPGKTYTVGRGIENDVVLTDIAVSRKHFDLRNDDGAWVLVDHGSGNGTVVNGNIEDNPFMLASGDVIEIGNTSFRFEQQNGAPRQQSFQAQVDDDDELSTVAGKPLRAEPPAKEPVYARPKTLPPPAPLAPLRSRSPSASPPYVPSPPMAPPIQPMLPPTQAPQMMGNRAPMLAPQAPTMLGDVLQPPRGMMPTTIPGQAVPRPMYYPQASEISPQAVGVHAHMLVMPQQQQRGDGSTVHVPPTPFGGLQAAVPARYLQPQLTKRAKYVLGGAALTLFAAIATVAIIKSGGKAKSAGAAPAPKPHVESIEELPAPKPTPDPVPKADPPKTDPPKVDGITSAKTNTTPPKVDPPRVETPKIAAVPPPKAEPPKAEPPKPAIVPPPKVDPPKVAIVPAPKVEPPKLDPVKIAKVEPPKSDPPKVAKIDKPVPKADPPKADPPKQTPKADPPKQTPKVANNKRPTTPPTESKPKRVAAAVDTGDIKNRGDELYRNKKFSEAASYLYAAAKSLPEEDAKPIRYTASAYDKLSRAYSMGTQPATKPIEAYQQLKAAESFDRAVGGAYIKEIQSKLAAIAPRAAIGFMAAKDFESAHVAVATAESLGTANETTKVVKQTLDARASELYQQAKDDPTADGAKEKLRKILKMVDPKSVWYGKAQKLLQG